MNKRAEINLNSDNSAMDQLKKVLEGLSPQDRRTVINSSQGLSPQESLNQAKRLRKTASERQPPPVG